LQLQLVTTPLPASENVPPGQTSHWLWFVIENLPASHCRQACAFVFPDDAAYLPNSHVEHANEPSCMNFPGRHTVHVVFAASETYPILQ
jgi:hypothetical protein